MLAINISSLYEKTLKDIYLMPFHKIHAADMVWKLLQLLITKETASGGMRLRYVKTQLEGPLSHRGPRGLQWKE